MAHIIVPAAEELLDKEIRVLDKGFIRLVDYLGGDARIVQAARVSYGAGTKTVREDEGLINYLLRNDHTSPFEQVVMTYHAKMPIFVARQWVRHRTARLNEISGRYSVMRDEFYVPSLQDVKFQSKDNKQGRGDEVPLRLQQEVITILTADQKNAYSHYEQMIDEGVAKELARIGLPLSLYTEWYWQIDLHNMLHFLKLRMDPHAQLEIREYANALAECTKAVAPLAYNAFEEHKLHSRTFSKTEVSALKAMLAGDSCPISDERRRGEFLQKLE